MGIKLLYNLVKGPRHVVLRSMLETHYYVDGISEKPTLEVKFNTFSSHTVIMVKCDRSNISYSVVGLTVISRVIIKCWQGDFSYWQATKQVPLKYTVLLTSCSNVHNSLPGLRNYELEPLRLQRLSALLVGIPPDQPRPQIPRMVIFSRFCRGFSKSTGRMHAMNLEFVRRSAARVQHKGKSVGHSTQPLIVDPALCRAFEVIPGLSPRTRPITYSVLHPVFRTTSHSPCHIFDKRCAV